jgi:hypothetical protein
LSNHQINGRDEKSGTAHRHTTKSSCTIPDNMQNRKDGELVREGTDLLVESKIVVCW